MRIVFFSRHESVERQVSSVSDTSSIDRKTLRTSHGSETSERRRLSSQASDAGERERRKPSQSSDVFLPGGSAKVIPQVRTRKVYIRETFI